MRPLKLVKGSKREDQIAAIDRILVHLMNRARPSVGAYVPTQDAFQYAAQADSADFVFRFMPAKRGIVRKLIVYVDVAKDKFSMRLGIIDADREVYKEFVFKQGYNVLTIDSAFEANARIGLYMVEPSTAVQDVWTTLQYDVSSQATDIKSFVVDALEAENERIAQYTEPKQGAQAKSGSSSK